MAQWVIQSQEKFKAEWIAKLGQAEFERRDQQSQGRRTGRRYECRMAGVVCLERHLPEHCPGIERGELRQAASAACEQVADTGLPNMPLRQVNSHTFLVSQPKNDDPK